jgi:hypothetical protein
MGQIRTLGLATAVKGTPTPAVLAAAYYTSSNLATPGVVIPAVTFSIKNNIATIVLTAATLPTNGYNGPNGFIPLPTASPASQTQSQNAVAGQPVNIQGNFPAPNGQKVVLWGFTTATYFNGKVVTVIDNNPATGAFRFYFTNADVPSTADAGNTAPCPFQHYRAIRLECSQSLSTDLIYVGDANVSSAQYMACLSLAGQLSIEIASENIPPEGLFIDTNGTAGTDQVMVTIIM